VVCTTAVGSKFGGAKYTFYSADLFNATKCRFVCIISAFLIIFISVNGAFTIVKWNLQKNFLSRVWCKPKNWPKYE
jgi:hypothetical protein